MVSDSRLNMWRAVIALAHADHKLTDEEIQFIGKKIKGGKMSADQQEILLSDLQSPAELENVLPKVSEPSDRAMLVYYGRLLVWSDGEYAIQEEKLLNMMNDNALSKVNLEEAFADARAMAEQHAEDYEFYLEEKASIPEPRSLVGKAFSYIVNLVD